MCSNAVAGESALDRMACGLGGKLVLPMIKEHIMQMLQNRKLLSPSSARIVECGFPNLKLQQMLRLCLKVSLCLFIFYV